MSITTYRPTMNRRTYRKWRAASYWITTEGWRALRQAQRPTIGRKAA
jgi:hypothetical protein